CTESCRGLAAKEPEPYASCRRITLDTRPLGLGKNNAAKGYRRFVALLPRRNHAPRQRHTVSFAKAVSASGHTARCLALPAAKQRRPYAGANGANTATRSTGAPGRPPG